MTPNHNLTKWLLGITICILLLLLCIISDLSMRDHHDHWNLRYVIWKAGLRDYNATEVLSGTTHDHTFHERLRGISVKEFEVKFPATFLKISPTPPGFRSDSEFYSSTTSYPGTTKKPLSEGWIAHFKNGRLVSFGYQKNIP